MLKDCSMKTFISYSKDRPAVEFMRREVVHSFHNINSGNVKLGNTIDKGRASISAHLTQTNKMIANTIKFVECGKQVILMEAFHY